VAGARGRRRKERGARALTCGTERPERERERERSGWERSADRRVPAVRERKRERGGAARAADLGRGWLLARWEMREKGKREVGRTGKEAGPRGRRKGWAEGKRDGLPAGLISFP
jgi:hypothetical protein